MEKIAAAAAAADQSAIKSTTNAINEWNSEPRKASQTSWHRYKNQRQTLITTNQTQQCRILVSGGSTVVHFNSCIIAITNIVVHNQRMHEHILQKHRNHHTSHSTAFHLKIILRSRSTWQSHAKHTTPIPKKYANASQGGETGKNQQPKSTHLLGAHGTEIRQSS